MQVEDKPDAPGIGPTFPARSRGEQCEKRGTPLIKRSDRMLVLTQLVSPASCIIGADPDRVEDFALIRRDLHPHSVQTNTVITENDDVEASERGVRQSIRRRSAAPHRAGRAQPGNGRDIVYPGAAGGEPSGTPDPSTSMRLCRWRCRVYERSSEGRPNADVPERWPSRRPGRRTLYILVFPKIYSSKNRSPFFEGQSVGNDNSSRLRENSASTRHRYCRNQAA